METPSEHPSPTLARGRVHRLGPIRVRVEIQGIRPLFESLRRHVPLRPQDRIGLWCFVCQNRPDYLPGSKTMTEENLSAAVARALRDAWLEYPEEMLQAGWGPPGAAPGKRMSKAAAAHAMRCAEEWFEKVYVPATVQVPGPLDEWQARLRFLHPILISNFIDRERIIDEALRGYEETDPDASHERNRPKVRRDNPANAEAMAREIIMSARSAASQRNLPLLYLGTDGRWHICDRRIWDIFLRGDKLRNVAAWRERSKADPVGDDQPDPRNPDLDLLLTLYEIRAERDRRGPAWRAAWDTFAEGLTAQEAARRHSIKRKDVYNGRYAIRQFALRLIG